MRTFNGSAAGRAGWTSLLIFGAVVLASTSAHAQSSADGVWRFTSNAVDAAGKIGIQPDTKLPQEFSVFQVDEATLRDVLATAPLEEDVRVNDSPVIFHMPMPDGKFERYRIVESPILMGDAALELPDYRSYLGQGIDDPTASIRFDLGALGFHAMGRSERGTLWLDPWAQDSDQVLSAWKSDFAALREEFQCLVQDADLELPDGGSGLRAIPSSGSQLTTYRTVLTLTDEYMCFFDPSCGSFPNPLFGVNQATITLNRINSIYEPEVAVRFTIVAYLYWYPGADPFPTGGVVNGALLDQNQVQTDLNVGSANYDVGHILSQGGSGGLAAYGVCQLDKARAGTSQSSPSGDPFDVDYVAHEMGHQMGGPHTFDGTNGSCNGNWGTGSRYEPGSGSTIMAYAGICGVDNLQANTDPYFHVNSLESIINWRDGIGSCGVTSATGNTPPVADAGPDVTIPRDTIFYLFGSATDGDGDPLTYTWEQYDHGSPLFRSEPPSSGGDWRYMPDWFQFMSGSSDPWEVLPSSDRTMTFRMTARDNRAGGGGVDDDECIVTVSGAPFTVNYPNGGESFNAGQQITATWTVGGGSAAPTVTIYVLCNGLFTFLASTANDGSESLTLPCGITSTTCRLWIQAETGSAFGAHFMDVSDADFSLTDGLPDYTPYTPAGWGAQVVARPTADGGLGSAPLPVNLIGDATSYFNWSYVNWGPATGCGAFENVLNLDERLEFTRATRPNAGFFHAWWNWGAYVGGGRHTAWQVSDPTVSIPETDETNNGYARQWVWTPTTLPVNTLVTRSAPPHRSAGSAEIPAGTTFFNNVDGMRIAPSANAWRVVASSSMEAASDNDVFLYTTASSVDDGFDGSSQIVSSTITTGTDGIVINTRNAGNATRDVGVLNWDANTTDYNLEYRQSKPTLAVGGQDLGNAFAANQAVALHEFFVAPGEAGFITIEVLNTTTSQPVTVMLFDAAFTRGSIYSGIQSTTIGVDGSAYLTRNLASGYYGVLVRRNGYEGTAAFTYNLKIWDTPADLLAPVGAGSVAAIVPRDITDTVLPGPPFPAPTFLTGDIAQTGLFIHYQNASPVASTAPTHIAWQIDGTTSAEFDFGTIPASSGELWQAAGAFYFAGGRHTPAVFVDSQDSNAEIFEANNRSASQWAWAPTSIAFNTPVVRGNPPDRIGGQADIPVGPIVYRNVDGVRSPVITPSGLNGYWGAVAVMPGSTSDVDVRIHDESADPSVGFGEFQVASFRGGSSCDYVVVNLNRAPVGPRDVGVLNWSSSQPYTVEAAQSTFLGLAPAATAPVTLPAGAIMDLYEVFLPVGTWEVHLQNVAGSVDWGLTVHDPDAVYDNLVGDADGANMSVSSAVGGQDEWIVVNVSIEDYYGIGVWKNAHADLGLSGDYILSIADPATGVSVVTGPLLTGLEGMTPNPFNQRGTVAFQLARASSVNLRIFDTAGRAIRTLTRGDMPAGRHKVVWDGRDATGRRVASGVYFIRLDADGTSDQRKVVLLK